MRTLVVWLTLVAGTLGLVGLAPSKAEAQLFRRWGYYYPGYSYYYPGYSSYYYPGYSSYYYPGYSSYYYSPYYYSPGMNLYWGW